MNFLRSLRYSMKFMRSYVSKKRKDFVKSFRFLLYSKFYKVIEYLNNTFIGVSSNKKGKKLKPHKKRKIDLIYQE